MTMLGKTLHASGKNELKVKRLRNSKQELDCREDYGTSRLISGAANPSIRGTEIRLTPLSLRYWPLPLHTFELISNFTQG